MSTFSNWDGPQGCGCNGGPKVDVTKLITAFEQMTTGLSSKLDTTTAASTYRKIEDSYSKTQTDTLLANKANTSVTTDHETRISALEESRISKDTADGYYAPKSTDSEGYANKSDLSGLLSSSTASATYLTKTDASSTYVTNAKLTNSISSAMATAVSTAKADAESKYVKASAAASAEEFDTHKQSHSSSGNDLKLSGKLLDNSGQTIAEVASINDTDGKTVPVLQLGDNTKSVAFPQRPMVMIPGSEEGKYTLKYLVTADEIGTVPVGGIIRWPINWQDCPDGTDILEFLKLDNMNGEWWPCSGATIPTDVEYNDIRAVLGASVFPVESYSIIHAKAAASVGSIPQDVWAMNTTVLADTLREKLLEAQEVIQKYNDMIATQNTLLASKAETSYVDANFTTKAEAATHETKAHALDTFATKTALSSERSRAQSAENQLGKNIHTISEKLDDKATWSALEGERAERRNMDSSLQQQILAEHVASHDEDVRLAGEILRNRSNIAANEGAIVAETAERKAADTALNERIGDWESQLAETNQNLQREQEDRTTTDELLEDKINALRGYTTEELLKEIRLREAAITEVESHITDEATTREHQTSELSQRVSAEKEMREYGDTLLTQVINTETENRTQADVALGERIDQEVADRTQADVALGERIDQEVADRTQADVALGERIDQEVADRTEAVANEAAEREAADTALEERIDDEARIREEAVNQEAERATSAELELQEKITLESATRERADTEEEEKRLELEQELMDTIEANGKQAILQFTGTDATALPQVAYDDQTHLIIQNNQLVLLDDGTTRQKLYRATVNGNSLVWTNTGYVVVGTF